MAIGDVTDGSGRGAIIDLSLFLTETQETLGRRAEGRKWPRLGALSWNLERRKKSNRTKSLREGPKGGSTGSGRVGAALADLARRPAGTLSRSAADVDRGAPRSVGWQSHADDGRDRIEGKEQVVCSGRIALEQRLGCPGCRHR